MRRFCCIISAFFAFSATATPEKTFLFTFHDAPLAKAIQIYSDNTGQKFVMDSSIATSVKVNIVESRKVSATEAFNLLSASLALSGVAISNRDGTYVLSTARNMERSFIAVVNELPPLQPERLVTWVVTLKHADASSVIQQLRMLSSKDGEVSSYGQNRLIFSDWVSNLYRVKELINQIDAPPEIKAAAPSATSKG